MPDRVDDEMLECCPDLGIVACALKGYDNFDVDACTRRGVWVTVVPDLLTIPTAELAVGLLIALARNVGPGDRFVRSGAFRGWRPALYGGGLDGSTVGILGAGRVGIAVAERLRGFGCARILCVDPEPPDARTRTRLHLDVASLDELLETSDFILCAAPLSPDTRHLIDADALRRVRPGCRLVNVGRGSVVDEQAVARRCRRGSARWICRGCVRARGQGAPESTALNTPVAALEPGADHLHAASRIRRRGGAAGDRAAGRVLHPPVPRRGSARRRAQPSRSTPSSASIARRIGSRRMNEGSWTA